MLTMFIRRFPFGTFYVVSCLFPLIILGLFAYLAQKNPEIAGMIDQLFKHSAENNLWVGLISLVHFALKEQPFILLLPIASFTPALAAIILVLISEGKDGLKKLLSRLKPYREGVTWQSGLKVYGVFAVIYFGMAIFYLYSFPDAGFADKYALLGGTPIAAFFTLLFGAFLDDGGLLEELGWRGYGLPLLIDRMRNPLTASLLLGILWALWHLPREIPQLLSGADIEVFLVHQSKFMIYCISISILATYMYNLTGGSVWAGIFVHGGFNSIVKSLSHGSDHLLGLHSGTVFITLVAIIILIGAGPKLGAKWSVTEKKSDRTRHDCN